MSDDELAEAFADALEGAEAGLAAANRLCQACVDLLDIDGAAISLIHHGHNQGTFGSSNELSRQLDEYQFTFGEGPCLDAVRLARPVLVPDLGAAGEQRWPAYTGAVLHDGVRAVYAIPVSLNRSHIAALDLFRAEPAPLSGTDLTGGLLAARLAALPLLDLMDDGATQYRGPGGGDPWSQLASLERLEVHQATGMVMAQLDVGPAEALVRLRAHAFAHSISILDAAGQILARRLTLDSDAAWRDPGGEPGRTR